jgi:hypothetical protein
MWQEIRVKVTALLLCVNYQLLQCPRFCFWFVFHHSTTMLAAICTHHDSVMMDWNFWDCLLVFFFCSWVYQIHYVCAYQIWVVCLDFVMVTCCMCFMFLELLVLEVRSIIANGRFLRRDFKKLSIELLIVAICAVWFAFLVLENNCLWDECSGRSNYCSFVFLLHKEFSLIVRR